MEEDSWEGHDKAARRRICSTVQQGQAEKGKSSKREAEEERVKCLGTVIPAEVARAPRGQINSRGKTKEEATRDGMAAFILLARCAGKVLRIFVDRC